MIRGLAQTRQGVIEYTLKGSGPVILNLHGVSSNCDEEWGYAPLLNAGFSILTPSRPGYGKTPSSVGETAEEGAGAMVGLLDSLNIESVFLVTVSGGGPTGLHLAAKYPERVKKLVLESAVSKPWGDDEKYKTLKKFYGRYHKLTWSLIKTFSNIFPRTVAKQTMLIFSTHDIDDIMKKINAKDIEMMRKFYRRESSARGALIDLNHKVTREVLNKIQVPTLIIHSQEDKAVTFDHAQYSKENIKTSELYIANTWSHFLWAGPGSDEVATKVINFLRDN